MPRRRLRAIAVITLLVIAVLYYRADSLESYTEYATQAVTGGGAVLRSKPQHESPPPAQAPAPPPPPAQEILAEPPVPKQIPPIPRPSSSTLEDVAATTSQVARTTNAPLPALPTTSLIPPQHVPPRLPALTDDDEVAIEMNEGRLEVDEQTLPPVTSAIHWVSQTEHYPVSSTIQLPTGSSEPMPRIQYKGKMEADQARLFVIKEAARDAWNGYKQNAWTKDEVRPISGGMNNPFNGWGATLVDSLDTLWLMGMKDDFEEAVYAVERIDFTTSLRSDVPVFETTIRYLGGLIAAYDVSDGNYRVLLDKAVELGDILMSIFDTPNRMPVTFYYWKPTIASQLRRAGRHVVLSEIGSLSLEFTRLAQVTGEPRFYDAVARITDGFEIWQNGTRLPGMWPTYLDASECGKPQQMGVGRDSTVQHEELRSSNSEQDCLPQVASVSKTSSESFTLGAKSDSMYEYLPKEYMLLGGQVEQYRTMYEFSAETAIDNLLYRPMTIDNRQILMSGELRLIPNASSESGEMLKTFVAEAAHLTCFAGGMFAMGAKLFNRPADLEIGKKLTDGCIWAYNVTATGIMPEMFTALSCGGVDVSDDDCKWNQTMYWKALDPYAKQRTKIATSAKDGSTSMAAATTVLAEMTAEATAEVTSTLAAPMAEPKFDLEKKREREKRQLGDESRRVNIYTADKVRQLDDTLPAAGEAKSWLDDDSKNKVIGASFDTPSKPELGTPTQLGSPAEKVAAIAVKARSIYTRPPPLSHEEFVRKKIADERLPPGFVSLKDRRYILRPEAIESVWYMYRITGDEYWREAGWNMFTSIIDHTRAPFGHSSIDDVTKQAPELKDTMESFWLAETLKYFYLLFEDGQTYSLDEWVLNTEAHFFKRPPYVFAGEAGGGSFGSSR